MGMNAEEYEAYMITEEDYKAEALKCLEKAFNCTREGQRTQFEFMFDNNHSHVIVLNNNNKYVININGDSVLAMIYDVVNQLYRQV